MIRAHINETLIDIEDGVSILEAARKSGFAIPTLCLDSRLDPIGSCRLCAVEIEGESREEIACRTPLRDGMRVITNSPAIEAFRRKELEWMAAHVSPESFSVEPEKELHRLLREWSIKPALKGKRRIRLDLSHPNIRVDMNQCISCFRCVKICEDLQGESVWHVLDRGEAMRIVPDSGTTLRASSCVGCGACVDTCPTGTLTDRSEVPFTGIEKRVRTTCAYCGVGCELEAGVARGRVVHARPLRDAPVSKGHLCVKGRYAYGFTNSPERQTKPLVRSARKWLPLSWDAALDRCAQEISRISAKHGPDSIGVLGSSRATNEENYLTQKFARVVVGTNNVDCCARVCHTPSAAALKSMLGAGASTNSFDDIERARTILVFGSNPLENHPIVGARIRQHVLKRGANLVVVDPRRTDIGRAATLHLQLRPGTNIPLLNAMAHVIVSESLFDSAFLSERVTDWTEFRTFIETWPPERASEVCGVAADDIRAAARLYAGAGPSMTFHGLGLTEHVQGTESVMALINLALLTGNVGKPGSGMNPLRGQNNVQGAAQMGCDPSILTGSVSIDERRALFEDTWKTSIPRSHGLDLMGMIDAASAGRLKALWIIGYDILPTLANMNETRRALKKLELIIVQDLFMTKTAEAVAHIFLPAASSFEKDGTFMNAERRIQRVRKVTDAPGEAWSDWRIICALAARMGHSAQFQYGSPEDIWNEVRHVWPEAAGISYERLERGGLQWPCRSENDPGTAILHVGQFSRPGRASLRNIEYVPTPEATSTDYPLLMTTGRHLYQFNAGTMTMRTTNRKLRAADVLDISSADANELKIANGERVQVSSRYGAVTIAVRVNDNVKCGEVFATFHDPRTALNKLTSPLRDGVVHSPEYKVTAVRVSRMPEARAA
jgi:formate dehydrogenase major subunit